MTQDIEAFHGVRKSKNNSKKTVIRFISQKYAKKALLNRKDLSNIDRSSIGLSNSNNIFIDENLTPTNSKFSFHYKEIKRDGHIEKTYTRDSIVYIRHFKL